MGSAQYMLATSSDHKGFFLETKDSSIIYTSNPGGSVSPSLPAKRSVCLVTSFMTLVFFLSVFPPTAGPTGLVSLPAGSRLPAALGLPGPNPQIEVADHTKYEPFGSALGQETRDGQTSKVSDGPSVPISFQGCFCLGTVTAQVLSWVLTWASVTYQQI